MKEKIFMDDKDRSEAKSEECDEKLKTSNLDNTDEKIATSNIFDGLEAEIKKISESMSKSEILSNLVYGYESIIVSFLKEDIKALTNALVEVKILKEAYMAMPEVLEKDVPKMEDRFKFSYTFSKLGCVDENIAKGINNRYKERKTILHNATLDNDRKDYVEAVVALIKMGANTTLKDNKGNTPIDYIPEDKVNDVYKNLEKTYKRYEGKAVGLRVLRAMVEIEENENFKDVLHNKEYNMKKYFESLENFAKNNYKDKTEEDMENILSIHIFNDKNKYVNKEREKIFLSKIKDNTCIVEGAQKFFKSKKLDFEGLTDKNTKWKCAEKDINKHYNEIVSDFNNSYKGTKVIRNYLLEENSTDFIKEKEEILKLLFLLTVSKDVELNSCLESDLKKIFLENPSQMNMIVDTKDDVIKFIWQNIDFDEHYMKTIWDNINFKTNYDVALKYMDLVDFNIKFYNKLEEKEEETLENIIDFINKHHFKQILLKLTNIIKKSKRNKIDDNVIDFLNDYREYLFLEQPLEVKDFIDNLVEKFDILEAIIGVENIELLRFMVENGRNINESINWYCNCINNYSFVTK